MKPLKPTGFHVFRRPLLSVNQVFQLFETTAGAPPAVFEAQLRELFTQPPLREAIYLASPSLFNRMEVWLREGVPPKDRLLRTLFKYAVRAGTRCTPYGLFAGILPPGAPGPRTQVVPDPGQPYTAHARLDTHYLNELTQYILGNPAVREQLRYFPNNTLYQIASEYRYFYFHTDAGARHYAICAIGASPYVRQVLRHARAGATPGALAVALTGPEVTEADARGLVRQLIEEQVLVSELQLRVTGPDFVDFLAGRLSALTGTQALSELLREVDRLLKRPTGLVSKGAGLQRALAPHLAPPAGNCLLQADLVFNTAANTLGQGVLDKLTAAFTRLLPLNQGSYLADLEQFKQKFVGLYGTREVPLLLALDAELGAGYGATKDLTAGFSPLVDDLSSPPVEKEPVVEWNGWKDFLLEKYSDALLAGSTEIVLEDADLDLLAKKRPAAGKPLPNSFAAFGNLLAASAEKLDEGEFLFNLYSITGPSAANLLTRFCHASPELSECVAKSLLAEEEQYADAILAEIVHLQEARTGNITTRPTLRKYEIPYLVRASVEAGFEIPLDDLVVSVNRENQVVLRSVRHNKQVIPRLSTAHDFSNGLTVYKFLCDLQFERTVVNVTWHWSVLEKQRFLPRVRYRNVIVSRATWRLAAEAHPQLKSEGEDLYAFFRDLRERMRMPRYVCIAEKDNEIVVDFENGYCLDVLRDELVRHGSVKLKEYLQVPGQCFLGEGSHQYANELIIPFTLASVRPLAAPVLPAPARHPQRDFAIGSEWLYLKLYTGEKKADHLLRTVLRELTEELLAEGLVDQWFFVRYADPDFHLRLRLHGTDREKLYHGAFPRINAVLDAYLQKGLLLKVQADTYQRELERYAGDTMLPTEALFFRDSVAVVRFLSTLRGDADEEKRWLFALLGTDALLEDFGVSPDGKRRLLKAMQESFAAEFNVQSELRRQLNEKYRADLGRINDCLRHNAVPPGAAGVLRERSLAGREAVHRIREATSGNPHLLDPLVRSYIHLFLNRLFISNPRLHEMVIYHYLDKYYTACAKMPGLAACR